MPSNAEISLNPTSVLGDILSSDGTSRTRVAPGTSGYILSAQSSASSGLEWSDPGSSIDYFSNISTATITSDVTSAAISNVPWSSYHVLKMFVYTAAQGSGGSNDTAYIKIGFHSTTASSAIRVTYNGFYGGYGTNSAFSAASRGDTSTGVPTGLAEYAGKETWATNEITMFTGDSTKQMCGFIKYFGGLRTTGNFAESATSVFHVYSTPTSINRIEISSPVASGLRAGTRIDLYGIKRYGA